MATCGVNSACWLSSSPRQVGPADPAQGVRGVTQTQLLPRGHGPDLAGLLRQLRLLGAELHQPVERHDGPGEHAARLPPHVRGQVSVQSIALLHQPARPPGLHRPPLGALPHTEPLGAGTSPVHHRGAQEERAVLQ